jgi:hypothetical protein
MDMDEWKARIDQLERLSASELEAMAIELYPRGKKRINEDLYLEDILEWRKYKMNENFVFTPEVIEKLLWIDKEIKHCVNQLHKKGKQVVRNLERMINKKDAFFNDYEMDLLIYPTIIEWSDNCEEECETEDKIFEVMDYAHYDRAPISIHFRCLDSDETYFEEVECWNMPFARNTEFANYKVGFITHKLFDHTDWSLPDIIRINEIWCDLRVEYQHFNSRYSTL